MSNLYTALTAQKTTQNNCIIYLTQIMTVLQANVFLTRIHRLMVTNKGRSAFPCVNHC